MALGPFVLVRDEHLDAQPSFDFASLASLLTGIMSTYEFNHRNAVMAYLTGRELAHSLTKLAGDVSSAA